MKIATALVSLFAACSFAATPVPVAKALPITASSYPFGAADHERVPEDLRAMGYVEEEYLLSGTANVGKPVLDANGNVTGGVRSPFVDVAVSTWFGSSTGESFCSIAGHEKPLDAAQLREMHVSRTAYVSRVTADVQKLERERRIVKADGDRLIEEAKTAGIP